MFEVNIRSREAITLHANAAHSADDRSAIFSNYDRPLLGYKQFGCPHVSPSGSIPLRTLGKLCALKSTQCDTVITYPAIRFPNERIDVTFTVFL